MNQKSSLNIMVKPARLPQEVDVGLLQGAVWEYQASSKEASFLAIDSKILILDY